MGRVKRTAVIVVSLYSILLLQTMHRLNDRRIFVTLEDSNFSPEVTIFINISWLIIRNLSVDCV